jgi:hypothetical protein
MVWVFKILRRAASNAARLPGRLSDREEVAIINMIKTAQYQSLTNSKVDCYHQNNERRRSMNGR